MTDINKIADEAKKVFDKIDKKFNVNRRYSLFPFTGKKT